MVEAANAPQATARPTVIFVPGFWESGSGAFGRVSQMLRDEHGFGSVATATLASTGHAAPGPTLVDDVAAVRASIEPTVERLGREVILVMHSAGGIYGSSATKGLTRSERAAQGKAGGIVALAYVTAGAFPVGHEMSRLPFFDIDEARGHLHCADARNALFNDIHDDAEAARWLALMQPEPADSWRGTVPHAGFDDAPSWYLVCERDACLPAEYQRAFAANAGAVAVHTCDAGHMVSISQPGTLARFVAAVADEVRAREGK